MSIRILFLGDVFGLPGIITVEKYLYKIKKEHNIDFVIAQGENVTGRKGLSVEDYYRLKKAGIDCFTMGNHVWADESILQIINKADIVRPFNVNYEYEGFGSKVFSINGSTLRVSSFMGVSFNELFKPWQEQYANSFLLSFDELTNNFQKADFHFIDFHAETTSEKYVFGLYVDGKVDAICGTHTHVQTNDAHILPNGTVYITDAGMVGPINSAIGVNPAEIMAKINDDGSKKEKFVVSSNNTQINGVIITLYKNGMKEKKNKIETLNIQNIDIYK
ncbi:TIGR00282 family metallophosphoesterase [Mycoplasma sp. 394]